MKNPSYHIQSKYCMRTEEGVINTIPTLKYEYNKNFKSNNKSITEILKLTENLEKIFLNLSTHHKSPPNTEAMVKLELGKLRDKIKESFNESVFIHDPSHVEELLYNQNILLETLQKIYIYIIS